MDRRQLLFGTTALGLARRLSFNSFINPQYADAGSGSAAASTRSSDRERARLRGPVRTVADENTRTEYEQNGNLLSWRTKSPDGGEYSDTYAYGPHGHIQSILSRHPDGTTTERVYSYDDTGRLLSILDSRGERATFDYDKQGHKTETRVVKKTAEGVGATAIGIDVMFADTDGSATSDFYFGASACTFKTTYNAQDRPNETHAYDADGHLLGRVVRAFDDQGRITGVEQITDDPMSRFPSKERDAMLAQSGASPDEMRVQLKKAFGAVFGGSGRSFGYDSNGRIETATVNQGMLGTFTRTYTYNDYGDVTGEHTDRVKNNSIPTGVPFRVEENGTLTPEKPPSEWPPEPDLGFPSDTLYRYKYDSSHNWTEETITDSRSPSRTVHRELTYY